MRKLNPSAPRRENRIYRDLTQGSIAKGLLLFAAPMVAGNSVVPLWFLGAVAAEVMAQYRAATSDDTPTVFASTASPYKFCGAVLTAIGETPRGDGVELLDQLHEASGVPVPRRLAALKGKTRRFDKTVEKQAMEQSVLEFLQ